MAADAVEERTVGLAGGDGCDVVAFLKRNDVGLDDASIRRVGLGLSETDVPVKSVSGMTL